MPKYIKDGAYTIVVDERAPSPKRSATPKTLDESDNDEAGDILGNSEDEDDGVQFGDSGDDRSEAEEEIDYTDPSFILQNLSISTPNFSADSTRLLPGREELANIICSQVRYYCYCAIDTFSRNPRPVSILIIGEGFIGSRVINDLIRNGCKEMLRICTRGDLTAEEWRARGIKADNNITALLDGERPDIVIITVENASFTAVCKQLATNYVISELTFVISCSFGFQRRKLFAQLHTPHVFRTFIEPEDIFSAYKKKAFTSLLAFSKGSGAHSPTNPSKAKVSPEQGEEEGEVDSFSRPQSRAATKDEESAVRYMANRYVDSKNLVYQLENYYAMWHHGFAEARHKALKNVYGIVIDDHGIEAPPPPSVPSHRRSSTDEVIEQMSLKKAMKAEAKLRSKIETVLNKMTFFHQCVPTYRAHFASIVSSADLHTLKAQKYTREQNNPKSGPNMGFERHRHETKGAAPTKNVTDLPGRPMHNQEFLEAIFRQDEDYSHFSGPGFDLMTIWDRKIEKTGSGLKTLQTMTTASEPNSPARPSPAGHSHSQAHNQGHGHGQGHARQNASHSSHGHSHERSHHGHHAHPPKKTTTVEEDLEREAQRELHEYGRRLSHYADREGTNIDRNYMQQYLESSSQRHLSGSETIGGNVGHV